MSKVLLCGIIGTAESDVFGVSIATISRGLRRETDSARKRHTVKAVRCLVFSSCVTRYLENRRAAKSNCLVDEL